jgi:hypothetical protein
MNTHLYKRIQHAYNSPPAHNEQQDGSKQQEIDQLSGSKN